MTGMDQVIQVIGAMVIFSLILLNMNRFILMNDMELLQNEYEQVAMAAGQSIINEGRILEFDDTDTTYTDPDKLGPDGDENRKDVDYPPFDDIDDFNGYSETKSVNGVEYQLECRVCYVERTDLDFCVNDTSNHKRLEVAVNNDYMDNPIRLHMIKSAY